MHAALTLASHADSEALLESTVLALVAMMLVDRTVATAAARVVEVATDRALEETLAALARQHAVVLAGALVAADDALGAQLEAVDGRRAGRGVLRLQRLVVMAGPGRAARIGHRRHVGVLMLLGGVMMLVQSRVMMQLRRRRR